MFVVRWNSFSFNYQTIDKKSFNSKLLVLMVGEFVCVLLKKSTNNLLTCCMIRVDFDILCSQTLS